MDITMIGLQNAGKTSLLRVLAVSLFPDTAMTVLHHPFLCHERELTDGCLGRRIYCRVRQHHGPCCADWRRQCCITVSILLLRATMTPIVGGPSANLGQLHPYRWLQHEARPERSCNLEVVSTPYSPGHASPSSCCAKPFWASLAGCRQSTQSRHVC